MTTFDFSAGFERTAVTLSSWPGYIVTNTRERIKQACATGCYCRHDGERTATLVQRNGGVWLQCDACGSSVGTAMKRADHQKADSYPHWRHDIVEAFSVQEQAHRAVQKEAFEQKFPDLGRAKESYADRAAEYEYWLRASPEWKAIKERILWRSRGICEACLENKAEFVHHLTYEYGKLPPAWHLRAVCGDCHAKLHRPGDEWCACGMARG